jgi:bacillithiol biosynthesis deacetylase BshB1
VTVEVLAVGPHPDDVEIGLGGTLAKLSAAGHGVGILDLTRGEMGTRGTLEERTAEAQEAAALLGVAVRENAGLPDSGLANNDEQRQTVARVIRRLRPGLLLAPLDNDRHPDHEAAHALVRDANYMAGLSKLDAEGAPHRAPSVLYYRVYGDPTPPDLVIDISETFATKMTALKAHASQFHNPAYEGEETYVSSTGFWRAIETRAAWWGSRVGVAYGEPLYSRGPIGLAFPPGLKGQA